MKSSGLTVDEDGKPIEEKNRFFEIECYDGFKLTGRVWLLLLILSLINSFWRMFRK